MGPLEPPLNTNFFTPPAGAGSSSAPAASSGGSNVGAVLGLVGSLASTGLSALFSHMQYNRSLRDSRENATIAYNRQLELLNNQRNYDSPAAQMSRYVAAGLHPGLVTGGLTAGPSPANVDSAAPAAVNPISVGNLGNQILTARAQDLESRNLDLQEKRINKMNELSDAEIRNIFKGLDLTDAQIENLRVNMRLSTAKIRETMSHAMLYDEQSYKQFLDNQFSEKTLKDRVAMLHNEFVMSDEKAKNLARMIQLSIAESVARINNIRADTKLKGATTAYSYAAAYDAATHGDLNESMIPLQKALTDYYVACAKNQDTQAAYTNLMAEFERLYGDDLRKSEISVRKSSAFKNNMEGASAPIHAAAHFADAIVPF